MVKGAADAGPTPGGGQHAWLWPGRPAAAGGARRGEPGHRCRVAARYLGRPSALGEGQPGLCPQGRSWAWTGRRPAAPGLLLGLQRVLRLHDQRHRHRVRRRCALRPARRLLRAFWLPRRELPASHLRHGRRPAEWRSGARHLDAGYLPPGAAPRRPRSRQRAGPDHAQRPGSVAGQPGGRRKLRPRPGLGHGRDRHLARDPAGPQYSALAAPVGRDLAVLAEDRLRELGARRRRSVEWSGRAEAIDRLAHQPEVHLAQRSLQLGSARDLRREALFERVAR